MKIYKSNFEIVLIFAATIAFGNKGAFAQGTAELSTVLSDLPAILSSTPNEARMASQLPAEVSLVLKKGFTIDGNAITDAKLAEIAHRMTPTQLTALEGTLKSRGLLASGVDKHSHLLQAPGNLGVNGEAASNGAHGVNTQGDTTPLNDSANSANESLAAANLPAKQQASDLLSKFDATKLESALNWVGRGQSSFANARSYLGLAQKAETAADSEKYLALAKAELEKTFADTKAKLPNARQEFDHGQTITKPDPGELTKAPPLEGPPYIPGKTAFAAGQEGYVSAGREMGYRHVKILGVKEVPYVNDPYGRTGVSYKLTLEDSTGKVYPDVWAANYRFVDPAQVRSYNIDTTPLDYDHYDLRNYPATTTNQDRFELSAPRRNGEGRFGGDSTWP